MNSPTMIGHFGIFNENCLTDANIFGSTHFTRKNVRPMPATVSSIDCSSPLADALPFIGIAVTKITATPYAAAIIGIRGLRILGSLFILLIQFIFFYVIIWLKLQLQFNPLRLAGILSSTWHAASRV